MKSRPLILLVQLPIPPLGPQPIRGNVPLAAGYLKLYAEQCGLDELLAIEILPALEANRLGDQALIDIICRHDPWMVGFTCYLWNIDRTLWLTEQLKRRLPKTFVVIGGPEVTHDNEWVLGAQSVDFAAIGEGERTFTELLVCLALSEHIGTQASLKSMVREPLRSWLEGLDNPSVAAVDGLASRVGGEVVRNRPRMPMPSLDLISSPYLAGILDAGDQEQLLLETIRGCVFNCKFCYYPKAYDRLYYVSEDRILANLAHAREHGAKEVYLLDPTLNQRRDFAEFLMLLARGNSDGRLEYYAELRAEGVTPEQAKLMREANFKEVEIGLQSIDPKTQDLMDRHNNLKAFERGVRALQSEGVRVKVDLIVGLPGDTVDSVRRGMHYLAENRLYDDIQVFQLSILPGTAFRHEAVALGLRYQPRPPYYVLETQTLSLDNMLGLLEESEDVFETVFDPLPPPVRYGTEITSLYDHTNPKRERGVSAIGKLSPRSRFGLVSNGFREVISMPFLTSSSGLRCGSGVILDLDRDEDIHVPRHSHQVFTMWFRARDPYGRLAQIQGSIREFLELNPFSTLQIRIETRQPFPMDVFKGIRAAWERPENIYLDRYYEFTPSTRAGARRIIVLLPAESEGTTDATWIEAAEEYSEIVWM